MTKIIGIDFSGAGSNNSVGKTWIAQGELVGNVLAIESCRPISRDCLIHKLESLKPPAVAAMDFPFSLPEIFARCWKPSAREMPDLWVKAACMEWNTRDKLRKELQTNKFAGLKRDSDPSEAISPLNIRMVQMTFRGMRMLHRLSLNAKSADKPLWIPPLLPCKLGADHHITLLEVMPGATVRSLVSDGHRRGYKGGKNWMNLRLEILDKLPKQAGKCGLSLSGVTERAELCLGNDDAMDAIVAAITAALWQLKIPAEKKYSDYPESSLVGWMYVPKPKDQAAEHP